MTWAEFETNCRDQAWRLNNLYMFKDRSGARHRFQMNSAQWLLYDDLHTRNIILKARQLGFTTWIQIFMFDLAFWHPDTACGVIAHKEDAAKDIFAEKIKFLYDHLPEALRKERPLVESNAFGLKLANGSSIRVGTSMRSGTLQALHISELGRTAAHYPDRAREIITGSLPTIAEDGYCFIESTAEGNEGRFFDLCQAAQARRDRNEVLDKRDFKFHFFSWHGEKTYVADPNKTVIPPSYERYFKTLAEEKGITLTPQQKAFYVKEAETQGEDMKREYPATPEEAFEASVEGAYYGAILSRIERNDQVTKVPYDPALDVETWWDIGFNDENTIWFVQRYRNELRVIDYYSNSGEALSHYAQVVRQRGADLGYRYSRHVGPHDMAVREYTSGLSRRESAEKLGLKPWVIAPKLEVLEGIDAVRQALPMCFFDKEKCADGLRALRAYRKEFDERRGTYKTSPLHDWASHPADAFRTGIIAPKPITASKLNMPTVGRA